MARELDVHNIRQFDKDGIRRIHKDEYELKEGIIRSGLRPEDFYVVRAEKLYTEYGVDRIFLLSEKRYEEDLKELAEDILKKCRNDWKRSFDDWLFQEDEHTFIDNVEVIDSERRGENEVIAIIQIDLVSNLYSTAEYYFSQIEKNPGRLSNYLVLILAGLYPEEWRQRLPPQIPNYNPRDILQLLKLMIPKAPLKAYFEFFHGFFTEKSWDIGRIRYELETLLETPTSYNEGLKDLHFVLRIIHDSLSSNSFSEIAELKSEIDNYFKEIPKPEKYTDMLYRKFQDLCVFIGKFQEETHFQDKQYFLEQSKNKIRESEILVKRKFVEPFKTFYLDILDKWMDIAENEGDLLLGRASIEARLQTKKAVWKERLLVSLNVKNVGTSRAENIDVYLQDSDEYEILERNLHHIDVLHRNREEDIDFYIRPLKRDSINLVFSIFYGKNNCTEIRATTVFVQQERFTQIPNPYSFTKPAEGEMFFNREDLFEWIGENMRRSTVYQNVLIEGQRRTGKTSFLKELQKIIKLDHYCIFVDLELYAGLDDIVFLHEICEELYRSTPTDVPVPSLYEFVNRRYLAFKNYAESISPSNPKKIILIFDEFDKIESNIEEGLFKPGFLSFLRGFFQHNNCVNVVISGNFDFNKLDSPEWKEFFTVFNFKKIGVLDERSSRNLVVKPVKEHLQYDEYAIKKIIDFSGRNPFYIQLLCHTLVNYVNEKKKQNFVEAEDISAEILAEARESAEPILRLMWEGFNQIERNILFALSQQRNHYRRSVTLKEIESFLREHGTEMKELGIFEVFDSLIERDLVTKSGENPSFYDFNIVLLRDWIAEHGTCTGE